MAFPTKPSGRRRSNAKISLDAGSHPLYCNKNTMMIRIALYLDDRLPTERLEEKRLQSSAGLLRVSSQESAFTSAFPSLNAASI